LLSITADTHRWLHSGAAPRANVRNHDSFAVLKSRGHTGKGEGASGGLRPVPGAPASSRTSDDLPSPIMPCCSRPSRDPKASGGTQRGQEPQVQKITKTSSVACATKTTAEEVETLYELGAVCQHSVSHASCLQLSSLTTPEGDCPDISGSQPHASPGPPTLRCAPTGGR
jgi:hypothetical protein